MSEFLSDFLPDPGPESREQVVETGLLEESVAPYLKICYTDIKSLLRPRMAFSHKGTYGHVLIVSGEIKTMGAALLTAKGCLYGGAGLTTACIPESGLSALNTALPEVMYLPREELSGVRGDKGYTALAVGPGIGMSDDATGLLTDALGFNIPMVLDADALNLMSVNGLLLHAVPENSIITPHMKEFDRVFGDHPTWFERLNTARRKSAELGIVIVLKNQYTFIFDQSGRAYINATGNPAMAQGGMGDVLTGIIAAYLAQGYDAKDAAIIACHLHGAAGDELSKTRHNVTASEIAISLPHIIKKYFNL